MNEGLIRVRDYAQKCGCTPQNIYGHLKTYATELEGHTFKGKGRQGILLDAFAQDFLQSVMYPKELAESTLAEEINTLRGQLLHASVEATKLASRLASVEGERDRALLELGENKRALERSREASEAAQKALEVSRDEFKSQAEENAQRASEEARKAAEAIQEAQTLREQLEAAEAREKALEDKKREFDALPFWKKPFWKG